MLTKPQSSHSFKSLFLLLPIIVFGAVMAIWTSIDTTDGVKDETEALIDVHIPELADIAALRVVMDERAIMLHKYYETMEPPGIDKTETVNKRFIQLLNSLRNTSLPEEQILKLTRSTDSFSEAAKLFDDEMRNPGRDWDLLREYLADANAHADLGRKTLESWNQNIRDAATTGAQSTLREVNNLSLFHIAFNASIAIGSLLLVLALYTHLRGEKKLFERAHQNEITQLPNRRALDNYAKEVLLVEGLSETHAFMLISMDRFAMLTGTYGHDLGNQLLVLFSQKLEALLEDNAVDARLFSFDRTHWIVCIREVPGLLAGRDVADLIVDFASQPLMADGRAYNVSCSVGVAYFPNDANELAPLIACADTARLLAVEQGGSRYAIYQTEMQKQAERCLAMEMRIQTALRNGEYQLHYQPKFAIDGCSVVSSEALIRWPHGEGFIFPGDFIPIAESTGLVIPLGTWVIRRACLDWLEWQRQGVNVPGVAVNVSAQQFQQEDFPDLVRNILEETGMPAKRLELEITEEASSSNPVKVVEALNALKAIGVSIAIDDFGTGYSSLSYLKQFPVDVLKIDRAFISQIDSSSNDAAIVKMIIDMAHQLGFKVVAEGVETDSQWKILNSLDCDILQGFLFSKPLSPKDYLEHLLSRSNH